MGMVSGPWERNRSARGSMFMTFVGAENTKNISFGVLNRFTIKQKIPLQGDHSKFEFLGCESMQDPQGGGNPGDICIL